MLSSLKQRNMASNQILCEPCLVLEKQEVATSLCSDCDEHLCAYCTNQHKTRTLTKSHVLRSNVSIKYTLIMIECGICDAETDQRASVYCSDCKEMLCKRCEEKHKEKTIFKHHDLLIPDIRSQKQILYCDPCKGTDEMKNAESFCPLCEENLCESCTRYHRALKATKHHKLKNLVQCVELDATVTHCDPCKEDGTETRATGFCVQCEENMCDDCTRLHKSIKLMKGHHINDINDVSNANTVWCGQCKEEHVFEKADKHCSDCHEYLCIDCCKKHKLFKLTKCHKLLDMQNIKKICVEACGVCRNESEHTQLCENCGLKFCHVCIEEHTLSKGTCACDQHQQYFEIQGPAETCVREKTSYDMNRGGQSSDMENIENKNLRPGKPRASGDNSKEVYLTWDPPLEFRDSDVYKIGYKDLENNIRWKVFDETFKTTTAILDGLPSNKLLIFRVRVIDDENEGPYSEESDEIRTPLSAACQIVQNSAILVNGTTTPSVYTLPMKEDRHEKAKINKRQFGSPEAIAGSTKRSKTILFVGETGCGKSTLIDFIVNYALGVNWKDSFRYKATDLDKESRKRSRSCVASLTDWVTCYTINNQEGSRINYQINMVDTPGFGNTDGLMRDQEIENQMRYILSDEPPYGLGFIDAICFVFKANENRMTSFQSYIFQSILSLFGKDIEQHICSLITFADSIAPSVIDTLREYKFPLGETFIFNNVSLFCNNDSVDNDMDMMFWQMGMKSLRSFFAHIEQLQAKSLHMTKMVLKNRYNLRETTNVLQLQTEVFIRNKKILEDMQTNLESKMVIEDLEQRVEANLRDVKNSIDVIKTCQDRLKEISLLSRPSSFNDYLELLIQNEEIQQSDGFLEKTKLLKELRHTVNLEGRISSNSEGND